MVIYTTQRFECETDSLDDFEKVLETMVGIMFKPTEGSQLFVRQGLVSINKMEKFYGRKIIDPSNPTQNPDPASLLLYSIADDKNEFVNSDKPFNSHAQLVQRVMVGLKEVDKGSLIKYCSDGFHCCFTRDKGSISQGYKLHRPFGEKNVLEVSLCHIYYGKSVDEV